MSLLELIRTYPAPRYWPTWLGLLVMWLLSRLPLRAFRVGGWVLGQLFYLLGPRRRRIANINLELCFPAMSATERQRIIRRLFVELGISAFETCAAWFTPPARLRRGSVVDGMEHLEAALARGNGVILLSGHFCNLEIGGCMLATHVDMCAMYRAHANPLFEAVMRGSRSRLAPIPVLTRNDIRGMIRALKQNLPIWYAPDQDYGRKHSIFVPFFGVPAATVTATSRLAAMSGAAVVPFFCEYDADIGRYRLRLAPALEHFPSEDLEADTTRVQQIIEAEIVRRPHEYLWVHRRFKTRPEGRADFYPKPTSRRGQARERASQ